MTKKCVCVCVCVCVHVCESVRLLLQQGSYISKNISESENSRPISALHPAQWDEDMPARPLDQSDGFID